MFLYTYVRYGIFMFKLFYKILNLVLETQNRFYKLKYSRQNKFVFKNSTSKTSMNEACTLKLKATTEENIKKVDLGAKEIIKRNIQTPEKLLDFIEKKGTKVYRTQKASTILKLIDEEEGFITPQKGFKALYLNFATGLFIEKKLKISFTTKEMFVVRKSPVDIYAISHQLHKWYGFKMQLPGYDYHTQEKFKRIYKTLDDAEIRQFSLADVISVKEAVARNVESINFVVNLAKEYDGSKQSLAKIMSQKGANI